MSLTKEDLDILRKPFPNETIGVKVQSLSKDRTKAMLVSYAQHTDVMNRLEEVDPNWAETVLRIEEKVTPGKYEGKEERTFYVYMKMTVKGVERENVGEGNDPKGAYSDAIKRCAMLFGVGRWLYDETTVWVPYNEQTDRYKIWTQTDVNNAKNRFARPTAAKNSLTNASSMSTGKVAARPSASTSPTSMDWQDMKKPTGKPTGGATLLADRMPK